MGVSKCLSENGILRSMTDRIQNIMPNIENSYEANGSAFKKLKENRFKTMTDMTDTMIDFRNYTLNYITYSLIN